MPPVRLPAARAAASKAVAQAATAPRHDAPPAQARQPHLVDADDLPLQVHQRPAAVAPVDHRVMPDPPHQAAHLLAAVERPGEAVALTEPLWTEAFQDAYDGHLPLRGELSPEAIGSEQAEGIWIMGGDGARPAAERFQVCVDIDDVDLGGGDFSGVGVDSRGLDTGREIGGAPSEGHKKTRLTGRGLGEPRGVEPLTLALRTLRSPN